MFTQICEGGYKLGDLREGHGGSSTRLQRVLKKDYVQNLSVEERGLYENMKNS